MGNKLEGKVAFVTGAASGIGREISLFLDLALDNIMSISIPKSI
jgi:NADP-dependent 3-hydroxy acid dehydrogenase YdfG